MSLIACAECGHQISDKAASCPKCGAPTQRAPEATITTQLTAKKFKLQELIGVLGAIVGILMATMAETSATRFLGAGFLLAGVVVFISARFRAWWHSG